MADKLTLRLGHPAPLLNVWTRMHWARKKKYMQQVAMEFKVQLVQMKWKRGPMVRCRIKITRCSTGAPDWDGLFACAKAPLDCLVLARKRNPHGLGVILDDNMTCVKNLEVVPVRVDKGEKEETIIEIQEVTDEL